MYLHIGNNYSVDIRDIVGIFDIVRNMQVFITTCNESALLPEIKGKIFRIQNGELIEN